MTDEHLVLYRKYRPKLFCEVVGQDHIVRVLQNALSHGRVAHSYLFSGPRGTGKTTVARLLAKAINCEAGKTEPCNTCTICEEFLAGRSLDLVEIDAASSRGIDEIRELREAVRFTPSRAKKKVYIVDEVHMLTKEAFNALLKTLEEPPTHAIFVLATTEPEKVPATIRSRAQHFEFRMIPSLLIQKRLQSLASAEKVEYDAEVPRLISLLAEGSLRDAESMFGQIMDGSDGKITKDDVELLFGLPKMERVSQFINTLLACDTRNAFSLIKQSTDQNVDPKMLTRFTIEDLRTMLLLLLDPEHEKSLMSVLDSEHITSLQSLKLKTDQKGIENILIPLLAAYHSPYGTVLPQIPLELAVLKITNNVKE